MTGPLGDTAQAAFDMVVGTRPVEPWLVVAIVVLLAVCLGAAALLLWYASRRRHRPFAPRPEDTQESAGLFGLSALFARADEHLRALAGGRGHRYSTPWFLILGGAGSGKSSLLASAAATTAAGQADSLGTAADDCRWWFLDHGMVIDPSGRLLFDAEGTRAPQRAWRDLLDLLERYRPKRPFDGVLLTLPCEDLLDTSPQGTERLRRKAGSLYDLLAELQRRLGMRPAVYVALTKADALPGFGEFAAALPEGTRRQMLGWASPFSPDAPFEPGWVDEALADIRAGLEAALFERFALPEELAGAGRALQFPGALERLREPLVAALSEAFRGSAYLDAAMLRGLWFVGTPKAGGEVAFVQDLVAGKVMPEFALSRPIPRLIRSTNRRVRIAQVALAVALVMLSVGLGINIGHLRHDMSVLDRTMREVILDVEMMHRSGAEGSQGARRATFAVLSHMAALDEDNLLYPFMPVSLFSSLDAQVEEGIRLAYQHVIFGGLRERLRERADRLASDDGQPAATEAERLIAPGFDELPEFRRLSRFVEDVLTLDGHVRLYHSIPDAPDVETLGKLVSYLYERELPRSFYVNSRLYEEPLRSVSAEGTDRASYAPRMAERLDRHFAALTRTMNEGGPLGLAVQDMTELLSAAGSRRGAAALDVAALARLRDAIVAVDSLLAMPEAARLRSDTFVPPATLARVVASLGDTPFFPPDTAKMFQRRMATAHADFRRGLLTTEADGFGLVLTQPAKGGAIELSRAVRTVLSDLEAMLSSEFAKAHVSGRLHLPAALPPGTMVKWNVPRLQRAMDLFLQWSDFMQNRERRAGVMVLGDQPIAAAGTEQLVSNMTDLVGGALSFEPMGSEGPANEAAIAAETANLRDAQLELVSLLQAYDSLGAVPQRMELSRVVEMQAARLMRGIDLLARADDLYLGAAPDFSWWSGTEPPAPRAFSASDKVELAQYLAVQRDRAGVLARQYAKPVVDLMLAQKGVLMRFDLQMLSRWQRVLMQLDAYDRKVPTSSVAQVESFIQNTMTRLTRAECGALLSTPPADQDVSDLFLGQRRRLEDALKGRCRDFQHDLLSKGLSAFIERYRVEMAPRFPFSGRAPRLPGEEVSPREADTFFRSFNEFANQGLGDPLTLAGLPNQGGPWRSFIDKTDRLRAFLAAGKLAEPAKGPGYLVEVEFRTDREREVHGSHVIEWALTIGDKTVTQRDSDRQLAWRYGDPVELRLRWAQNAPTRPRARAETASPFLMVSEQTVVFRYDTGWSLLGLVADTGVDGPVPAGETARLLGLTVPVAANPDGGSDPDQASRLVAEMPEARLFLKLRLMTPNPEGRTMLTVPPLGIAAPPALISAP